MNAAHRSYDIFNGDADGLCALQQLRLIEPRTATLITGTKRDISLLDRIDASAGDTLTVLDISIARNIDGLTRALMAGADITWFDHHYAGSIPVDAGLKVHVDTDPDVCTSLLVDRHVGGLARAWAIVGAFGDNLLRSANALAIASGYSAQQINLFRRLGQSLNYNAYGEEISDLIYPPDDLHRRLLRYVDPGQFAMRDEAFVVLDTTMNADLARASEIRPRFEDTKTLVLELPDKPWSRRVSGAIANRLAAISPGRAHAVLTPIDNAFTVSVRAPLEHPEGADVLARRFEGGGGRSAAAGIDGLPPCMVDDFIGAFRAAFNGSS
jgi:hypothetical protein